MSNTTDQLLNELDDLSMDLGGDVPLEPVELNMEIVSANPHDLQPNPWNPNSVDPINQDKLEASIRLEGIKRPIVVRELEDGSLQIIGGQHRTQAAISLHMESVPVINRGRISDAQAKRETLIDNFRYGTDNIDRMAALLSDADIGSAAELLATMPIDEEELAGYFEHLASEDLAADLDAALDDVAPGGYTGDDDASTIDLGAGKPTRTHTLIRFRVSLEDAERVGALIKRIKIDESLIGSDDMTNDGDALIHLLRDMFE